MSIRCLLNGIEVRFPCSPACELFGDCVTAFEAQRKANVRTNADRIRAMSDRELADFLAAKLADIHAQCAFEKEPPTATQLHAIAHTYFCAWMQWLKQPAEGE